MHSIWFVLIGVAVGGLASVLVSGRGIGRLGDVAVGVIGALSGGFVFDRLGVHAHRLGGSLLASLVGALVLLAFLKLTARPR